MTVAISNAAPTVSQVAHAIDGALRELGDGWVEGEVRSVSRHRSGHVYLTLADESANIDACIWKGRVPRCTPLPAQGDLVQAHYERVNFYAPYGKTSLIVDYLRPTGEGELLRRRAATLAKLKAEGLCDRRKPLPAFPRRVGVIAGAGSDAREDVIRHLRERWPAQDVVFCPATVQGVDAVGSVIDALGRLQAIGDVDVIILARGGGSVADLVPFDDERLCRAIVACTVAVITSIGHTKDRPNCDHVAAAHAPVPAKAAELAIRRSAAELLESLDRDAATLGRIPDAVRRRRDEVAARWQLVRARRRVAERAEDVDRAGGLLVSRADSLYRRRQSSFAALATGLDRSGRRLPRPAALDPLREELRERARAFIGGCRTELDAYAAGLAAAWRRHPSPQALDALAAHVDNAGVRVRAKRGDYLRALDRLADAGAKDLRRRLAAVDRDVDADARQLRPAADRAIARRRERVAHLGALVDAKDFRRLGWVLAVDARGRAVRRVGDLAAGDELALRFADGVATAAVERVKRQHEGEMG